MRFDLDQTFATHARALQIGNQRMELLSANIANSDTPGFLARDIDFRAAMQAVEGSAFELETTRPSHIHVGGNTGPAEVLYRTSIQPTLDGNTVDTERESAAVAETAARYEATLMFINSKIQGLRLAITGGN
jgi:flagellar basal-body rod protein FlgB